MSIGNTIWARFAGITILPGWFPASSGRLTLDHLEDVLATLRV